MPAGLGLPDAAPARERRGGALTAALTPEPPRARIGANNRGPNLTLGSGTFGRLLAYLRAPARRGLP